MSSPERFQILGGGEAGKCIAWDIRAVGANRR
jgi:hypothetical protein